MNRFCDLFFARATTLPRLCLGPALLGLALFAGPARADAGAPPALNQGPMIHLPERQFDFGPSSQHAHLVHSFHFTNEGTAPLRIRKVQTDCGCTVAMPKDSVLAPGDSSYVKVDVSTLLSEGSQVKVVTLYTNDPAEPRIDLAINCFVRPEVQVDNRILDFGHVKLGETPTLYTHLAAAKGTGFKINSVDGAEKYVTREVHPSPCDTADAYEVAFQLRPDAPIGPFNERVDLPLHHTKIGVENVSVRGLIYSYFIFSDPRLIFVPVKTGKRYTLSTTVDCDGGKPYKLVGATASAADLRPSIKEKHNQWVITVTLEPQDKTSRRHEEVILTTTDPAQPEMHLPVEIMVKD